MIETAVSNSSCQIGLERIQRTEILAQSFDVILIPPAVQEEIGFSKEWLGVKPVQNHPLVNVLGTQIGLGESESIALAMEEGDVFVILDDKKARRIARQILPRVIGTIGILLRAKRKGIIKEIKPILDALNAVNFRICDSLYRQAIELAKER